MAATAKLLARRGVAQARARRGPDPPVVLTDSRGARFELLDRSEVAAFLEHGGHFESAELDLLRDYLRPGDAALDVGANLGHFTATMARAVEPGGQVHAFEPLAANRERLARTLELNGLANVRVEAAAAGATAGEVELTDYGQGYGSWATTRPREIDPRGGAGEPAVTRAVPQVTLDAYAAAHGLERIAALKVDVEGAELEVLSGARGLLDDAAVDLLVVEVSDNTLPEGTHAWQLVERLAAPPLRSVALRGGELVPFRAAGRVDFATVVALTPAGRERLDV